MARIVVVVGLMAALAGCASEGSSRACVVGVPLARIANAAGKLSITANLVLQLCDTDPTSSRLVDLVKELRENVR